jgi:AcrR family transcriptional regulator
MFDQGAGRRVPRRDQLLSIAADLFAAAGFAGVTVDDIGAAAGISGPALYHHFDSKEALLGEMLIRVSESLLNQARAVIASTDDVAGQLAGLLAMQVEFAVDNTSLITVHIRDLVHTRKGDRRRVRDLQNLYIDVWVDVLMAQGPHWPDPRVARTAVQAAISLINSTPFSGRLRRDEMVPLLRTMAAAALASQPTAPSS